MTAARHITDGYHDIGGHWHQTSPATRAALAAAMGRWVDDPPAIPGVWRLLPGEAARVDGLATLHTDDGAAVAVEDGHLPPDLPIGYHELRWPDGGRALVLVSPRRCPLPERRRWGWAAQVYALRSSANWGHATFTDLATLGRWTSDTGAGVVATNPFHAPQPVGPVEPSPYYPSSRRWRSPLYLDVTAIDDAGSALDLGRFSARGDRLKGPLVDRDGAWTLVREALETLWRTQPQRAADADLHRFRAAHPDLDRYATYCALAEVHGAGWSSWPSSVSHPDAPGVAAFATDEIDRVAFHCWVQFLLDRQLAAAAAASPGLMGDLAVGFDPGGADAWDWQDLLAPGVRIGAPPDEFNAAGQDWGLPPFVPDALVTEAFEPLRSTLRLALAHQSGLRIDHVMGLFRLFWVPPGHGPDSGAYVAYPSAELLDVVAIEAHRAGCWIVGEDLGTVPDEVRHELAERQVLSYRLGWFEPGRPADAPEQSLFALTTHDLPTVAGLWSGADADDCRAAGVDVDDHAAAGLRARLVELAGVPDADAPVDDVVRAATAALAEAPSLVVLATLDDAVAAQRRPNLPGTVSAQRPNWSIPLPVDLDALADQPLAVDVARTLTEMTTCD